MTAGRNTMRALALAAVAVPLAAPVLATQGTFPHGYGVKAEGMGGVSIALPQDAVAGANNPAGMVEVGDRLDVGAALLKVDNGAYFAGTRHDGADGKHLYAIPQLGYNRMLGTDRSLGVSVVGNGVGTDHGRPVGPMSEPESELQQMVATVSYAQRVGERHSVGVGLVLGYQRLRVEGPAGLGLPEGRDDSYGAGVSVGWQGRVTPSLTFGANYASKVRMSRMDEFENLLAGRGDLDVPAHYALGAAWSAGATTLAADLMRIEWSDVGSLGNPGVAIAPGAPGASDGPGFGWKDQTVWRVGVAHAFGDRLTLRAGYSHGTQILDSRSTFLGIVAPSANRRHVTVGATVALDGGALSLAYARSPKETVRGDGPGPNAATDLYMGQHWLSASYAMKF